MKRRFSMGQALGAPFGLLKRRPGMVFVWGFARVIFGCLLLAALWPMFSAMMGDLSALAAISDPGGDMPPEAMAQMMRFQGAVYALNIIQAVLGIIIFNATMRATWAGGRGDGFAFMRIGMDELRVVVTTFAIVIGFYVALIVLIILGVGVFFAAWSLGEQVAVPIMVAYGGLAGLAMIWGIARVILIIPVSVIDKTFAFESGWALGRGQAAKLAVTGVLSCLILMLIELVFVGMVAAVAVAIAAASGGAWQGMDWSGDQPPTPEAILAAIRPLWPLLIFVVPAIFLTGFAQALFASPLASAARQLLDSGRPPTVIDPSDDGLSPITPATAVMAEAPHDDAPAAPDPGHSDASAYVRDDHAAPATVEAVSDGHADGHDGGEHADAPAEPRHEDAQPDPVDDDPHAKHGDGH